MSTDMSSLQGHALRSSNLLAALIAVLTGALVFLPAVLAAVNPPFILVWFLPAFWILGIMGVVCLGISFYFVTFTTTSSVPHRIMGIGSMATVAALSCLAVYIGANMIDDRVALPIVDAIELEPLNAAVGQTVKFTATAHDQNGDALNYRWTVDGQVAGTDRVVYWTAPDNPGRHEVKLTVDDGIQTRGISRNVVFRVMDGDKAMANDDEVLRAAAKRVLSELKLKQTDKAKPLETLTSPGEDISHLAEPISWDDPETRTRLLEGALLRASAVLPDADWRDLLVGKRPSCREYPGIWPFCNPKT